MASVAGDIWVKDFDDFGDGRNIAEALAYRGSDLVLVSRNAERLEEAARKVRAIGRRAVAVSGRCGGRRRPRADRRGGAGIGWPHRRPGEQCGAVIFLASDASAYITGRTLHVNGGLLMVD